MPVSNPQVLEMHMNAKGDFARAPAQRARLDKPAHRLSQRHGIRYCRTSIAKLLVDHGSPHWKPRWAREPRPGDPALWLLAHPTGPGRAAALLTPLERPARS
jgi:hypothetical protein